MTARGPESYGQYVILAIALAGVILFIVTGLVWTARLVHIGNLDAQALADKTADHESLQRHARKALGRFVSDRTRRRPMIVPVVVVV